MDNTLIVAFFTTALYCFFKFIEYKFIDKKKEMKPLKYFVRDTVIVFVSSFIAGFVFFSSNTQIREFVNTITDSKVIPDGQAVVFTDAPGF